METNYLFSRSEGLEEIETEMSSSEFTNKKHLKLVPGDQKRGAQEDEILFTDQNEGVEVKQSEIADEDEEVMYADLQNMSRSSLAIYFKSINKYPLLDEDTERTLAKLIKKGEKDCTSLIGKWRAILKSELIQFSPVRQVAEVKRQLKQLDTHFTRFDDILSMEKEWKKVNRLLKQASKRSRGLEQLQDELNKIEAEISKSISG